MGVGYYSIIINEERYSYLCFACNLFNYRYQVIEFMADVNKKQKFLNLQLLNMHIATFYFHCNVEEGQICINSQYLREPDTRPVC